MVIENFFKSQNERGKHGGHQAPFTFPRQRSPQSFPRRYSGTESSIPQVRALRGGHQGPAAWRAALLRGTSDVGP